MCCSDYHAVTLMNYFSERGVRIPEDLSFTGFDDTLLSRVTRPALTTVRQNITRKGILAVDNLMKMIQEEEQPEWDTRLPVEIVVRDSVSTVSVQQKYQEGGSQETEEKVG